MGSQSNVVTGLLATLLGIVMIVWVIPAQTVPAIFASVPSGFYPNFTSVMLISSGIALMVSGIFSAPVTTTNRSAILALSRFAAAMVLLVTAMFLTSVIGFYTRRNFGLFRNPVADAGRQKSTNCNNLPNRTCADLGDV